MDKNQGKKIIIIGIIQVALISVLIPVVMSKTVWNADKWDEDKKDIFSILPVSIMGNQFELYIEEYFTYGVLTQGWVNFENLNTGESVLQNFELTSYVSYMDHESTTFYISLTPGEYSVSWNTTIGSFDILRLTMIGMVPEIVGYVTIVISIIIAIGVVLYVRRELQTNKFKEKYTNESRPARPNVQSHPTLITPSYSTTTPTGLYCPYCGKLNKAENKFCFDCGSQL